MLKSLAGTVTQHRSEILIGTLDCENAMEFYRFGSDYSFVNLKCAALNCIRENFNSLAQGADPYILEVPEQYLSKIEQNTCPGWVKVQRGRRLEVYLKLEQE